MRSQRREGQDESGNGPSEGPGTNDSLNNQRIVARLVCTLSKSQFDSDPLGMSESVFYVTRGDPVGVREPESLCRKSAES